ncbi:autotransporter outer membrane beta-barrel domain-containing protein [Pseudomonas sp. CFBP 13727]|uniref:autotransporter outer membrane beta-barrel domain-containing protein n=1 Tax=Pseudomonas sp. CFBP 13727 TaxID=2775295 RepID=UPI00178173D0|nr:autotransporter outer membrane beta-barrel domain-containing protein [Pseudomonas sp. CFBP 13727]MBD8625306.1 autotransporter outer membrane beta-barrel domain-containing protein [Pseudomonas sp. CFBP 13727]
MSRFVSRFILPGSFAAGLLVLDGAEVAAARDLTGPGDALVIYPEAAITDWRLREGASLYVKGAKTLGIEVSSGSALRAENAQINGGAAVGVRVSQSTASITGSTVVSTGNYALIASNGSETSGAQVSVFDSVLLGSGSGVSANYNNAITLANTQVLGRTANTSLLRGGNGILMLSGDINVTQGSNVVGETHGAVLSMDTFVPVPRASNLVVDNARVEGQRGAAIAVQTRNASPVQASIIVRNGATLLGGDGVILQAGANTTVDFTAANTDLTGDIQIDADSTTAITLQDNARLTGTMAGVSSLAVDSGALWRMTQSASIGDVSMNGGRIDLGGTSGAFRELTLGSLAGNGTFGLGTDLATGQGDTLVITGQATGDHLLAIHNTGTDVAEGQDPLTVVKTAGGDARFAALGGQIDLGTFVYDLKQTGDDWQLVQRPGNVVTPGTASVLGLFSAAPSVWYGELSTLRSRMGELRMGKAEGGLWTRAYGNKYNLSAGGGVAYRQQQNGFSLGADAPLVVDHGTALVGAMVGYSKSDLDLKGGTSGEVDSFYLGVYGTWLGDDGYYVDALAKLNRFQNSSEVRMSDGTRSRGSYSHHGIGASLEAGRRIAVTETVAVTPFAQVSALKVQGQGYTLNNGMEADSNRADSLLAKAGAKLSQTLELDAGGTFEYYAKAALAHEFASNNQVKVNGNRFTNDLSGSRGEFGLGLAAQMSDRLQLHTEFDYAKGRNLEQPWGVNVGLRYSF